MKNKIFSKVALAMLLAPTLLGAAPAFATETETPAPEVPETPAPEVPETPAPEVPETPAPEVPETPAPEVPTADAATPNAPAEVAPAAEDPEAATVTINLYMKSADGSEVSVGSMAIGGKVGEQLVVPLTDEYGSVLSVSGGDFAVDTSSGQINLVGTFAKDLAVKVVFTLTSQPAISVPVVFMDSEGYIIPNTPQVILYGVPGATVDYTPPAIDGYVYNGPTSFTVPTDGSPIVVEYDVVGLAKITVNLLLQSADGSVTSIGSMAMEGEEGTPAVIPLTEEYGTVVSVTGGDFAVITEPGGQKNLEGTFTDGLVVDVVFTLEALPATSAPVVFVDEEGNLIPGAPHVILYGVPGDMVDYVPPTFDGYEYEGPTSFEIPADGSAIVIQYKKVKDAPTIDAENQVMYVGDVLTKEMVMSWAKFTNWEEYGYGFVPLDTIYVKNSDSTLVEAGTYSIKYFIGTEENPIVEKIITLTVKDREVPQTGNVEATPLNNEKEPTKPIKGDQKELPKTGEKENALAALAGITMVATAFFMKKRKENEFDLFY